MFRYLDSLRLVGARRKCEQEEERGLCSKQIDMLRGRLNVIVMESGRCNGEGDGKKLRK